MRVFWGFPILLFTAVLGTFSLLIIFSVNKNLATSQLVFWLIGALVLIFASSFDHRNWQRMSLGIYLAAVILLILVFFVGEPIRGSTRWISFPSFRFQPSELAKIATIFALAGFYSKRQASQFKNVILSFLLILPIALLILREPDIGNALSVIAIWLGTSIAAGLRPKTFLLLFVVAAFVAFLGYEQLALYQKQRILSFLNPTSDPLTTGYNVIQSKIAAGSGQLFGRGLGRGSQSQLNFLPEAESDFIFASTAEQLGFFGAGIVISIYGLLCLRIIKIAQSTDRFASLTIAGIVSFLLFQFLVNVGMNMGIIPVTGITFPLVSYGGSSLISTLFLIGVVLSVKRAKNLGIKYYEYNIE